MRGTQVAWDSRYTKSPHHTQGRHHFNVGNRVMSENGVHGNVVARTALTAHIQWEDGTTTEVEQCDSRVAVKRQ